MAESREVPFRAGAPFVDPEVTPRIAEYLQGATERRQSRLVKYNEQVGGGASPAIPKLDAPYTEGHTMAAQAANVNSAPLAQQQHMAHLGRAPGSIVESALTQQSPVVAVPPPAVSPQLRGDDMLPEQARSDPNFRTGSGAMYAQSQPELAARYGVMRNGQFVPPQRLRGSNAPAFRPETLAGLAALQNAQKAPPPDVLRAAEDAAEKQIEGTAAAHSASAGEAAVSPEDLERARQSIEMMDNFDFSSLQNTIRQDVLNNESQRTIIEARLAPIEIDELILKNRCFQRVPIIPKRFEVTFLSMTGEDDLALKRLLMEETRSTSATDRYLLDKFAFMSITCGIHAINNTVVPTHLVDDSFNAELFDKKFDWMIRKPLHMLASIGVNHTWFEMRMRRLFVAANVKNG